MSFPTLRREKTKRSGSLSLKELEPSDLSLVVVRSGDNQKISNHTRQEVLQTSLSSGFTDKEVSICKEDTKFFNFSIGASIPVPFNLFTMTDVYPVYGERGGTGVNYLGISGTVSRAPLRVNVDFSEPIILSKIEIDNYYNHSLTATLSLTTTQADMFNLYGSNQRDQFTNVLPDSLTGYDVQLLSTGKTIPHSSIRQPEFQPFSITSNEGFRYYSLDLFSITTLNYLCGVNRLKFYAEKPSNDVQLLQLHNHSENVFLQKSNSNHLPNNSQKFSRDLIQNSKVMTGTVSLTENGQTLFSALTEKIILRLPGFFISDFNLLASFNNIEWGNDGYIKIRAHYLKNHYHHFTFKKEQTLFGRDYFGQVSENYVTNDLLIDDRYTGIPAGSTTRGSHYSDITTRPDAAIDGDSLTNYYMPSSTVGDLPTCWWELDMKDIFSFNKIIIKGTVDYQKYRIYVSLDGVSYDLLTEVSTSNDTTTAFDVDGEARFIKITFHDTKNGAAYARLYDFAIKTKDKPLSGTDVSLYLKRDGISLSYQKTEGGDWKIIGSESLDNIYPLYFEIECNGVLAYLDKLSFIDLKDNHLAPSRRIPNDTRGEEHQFWSSLGGLVSWSAKTGSGYLRDPAGLQKWTYPSYPEIIDNKLSFRIDQSSEADYPVFLNEFTLFSSFKLNDFNGSLTGQDLTIEFTGVEINISIGNFSVSLNHIVSLDEWYLLTLTVKNDYMRVWIGEELIFDDTVVNSGCSLQRIGRKNISSPLFNGVIEFLYVLEGVKSDSFINNFKTSYLHDIIIHDSLVEASDYSKFLVYKIDGRNIKEQMSECFVKLILHKNKYPEFFEEIRSFDLYTKIWVEQDNEVKFIEVYPDILNPDTFLFGLKLTNLEPLKDVEIIVRYDASGPVNNFYVGFPGSVPGSSVYDSHYKTVIEPFSNLVDDNRSFVPSTRSSEISYETTLPTARTSLNFWPAFNASYVNGSLGYRDKSYNLNGKDKFSVEFYQKDFEGSFFSDLSTSNTVDVCNFYVEKTYDMISLWEGSYLSTPKIETIKYQKRGVSSIAVEMDLKGTNKLFVDGELKVEAFSTHPFSYVNTSNYPLFMSRNGSLSSGIASTLRFSDTNRSPAYHHLQHASFTNTLEEFKKPETLQLTNLPSISVRLKGSAVNDGKIKFTLYSEDFPDFFEVCKFDDPIREAVLSVQTNFSSSSIYVESYGINSVNLVIDGEFSDTEFINAIIYYETPKFVGDMYIRGRLTNKALLDEAGIACIEIPEDKNGYILQVTDRDKKDLIYNIIIPIASDVSASEYYSNVLDHGFPFVDIQHKASSRKIYVFDGLFYSLNASYYRSADLFQNQLIDKIYYGISVRAQGYPAYINDTSVNPAVTLLNAPTLDNVWVRESSETANRLYFYVLNGFLTVRAVGSFYPVYSTNGPPYSIAISNIEAVEEFVYLFDGSSNTLKENKYFGYSDVVYDKNIKDYEVVVGSISLYSEINTTINYPIFFPQIAGHILQGYTPRGIYLKNDDGISKTNLPFSEVYYINSSDTDLQKKLDEAPDFSLFVIDNGYRATKSSFLTLKKPVYLRARYSRHELPFLGQLKIQIRTGDTILDHIHLESSTPYYEGSINLYTDGFYRLLVHGCSLNTSNTYTRLLAHINGSYPRDVVFSRCSFYHPKTNISSFDYNNLPGNIQIRKCFSDIPFIILDQITSETDYKYFDYITQEKEGYGFNNSDFFIYCEDENKIAIPDFEKPSVCFSDDSSFYSLAELETNKETPIKIASKRYDYCDFDKEFMTSHHKYSFGVNSRYNYSPAKGTLIPVYEYPLQNDFTILIAFFDSWSTSSRVLFSCNSFILEWNSGSLKLSSNSQIDIKTCKKELLIRNTIKISYNPEEGVVRVDQPVKLSLNVSPTSSRIAIGQDGYVLSNSAKTLSSYFSFSEEYIPGELLLSLEYYDAHIQPEKDEDVVENWNPNQVISSTFILNDSLDTSVRDFPVLLTLSDSSGLSNHDFSEALNVLANPVISEDWNRDGFLNPRIWKSIGNIYVENRELVSEGLTEINSLFNFPGAFEFEFGWYDSEGEESVTINDMFKNRTDATPDSSLWISSNPELDNIRIQNNMLYMSKFNGDTVQEVKSLYKLEGDFEISVDMVSYDPNSYSTEIRFEVVGTSPTNNFSFTINASATYTKYNGTNTLTTLWDANFPNKLTLKREGTTLKAILNDVVSAPIVIKTNCWTDPVTVRFILEGVSYQTSGARFKNFNGTASNIDWQGNNPKKTKSGDFEIGVEGNIIAKITRNSGDDTLRATIGTDESVSSYPHSKGYFKLTRDYLNILSLFSRVDVEDSWSLIGSGSSTGAFNVTFRGLENSSSLRSNHFRVLVDDSYVWENGIPYDLGRLCLEDEFGKHISGEAVFSSEEKLILYCRLPYISNSENTKFFIRYDATKNNDRISWGNSYYSKSVWNENIKGVYHLNGIYLNKICDSSPYLNHSYPILSSLELLEDSPNGSVLNFNGSTDVIRINQSLNQSLINKDWSVSFWKKSKSPLSGSKTSAYSLSTLSGGYCTSLLESSGKLSHKTSSTTVDYTTIYSLDDIWDFVVITYSSTGSKVYLNGDLVITDPVVVSRPDTGFFYIGQLQEASQVFANLYRGSLSEFRFYDEELSASWIKLDYLVNKDLVLIHQLSSYENPDWSNSPYLDLSLNQIINELEDSEYFTVKINLNKSAGSNNYDCSDVFNNLGENKLKIGLFSDDNQELKCYIADWDSVKKEATIFTKIPITCKKIRLYYDKNQSDNFFNVTSILTPSIKELWSEYSVFFYKNTLLTDGRQSDYGEIYSEYFDGIDDHIDLVGSHDLTSQMTLTITLSFDDPQFYSSPPMGIFTRRTYPNAGVASYGMTILDQKPQFYVGSSMVSGTTRMNEVGKEYVISVTLDNTYCRVYLNGELDTSSLITVPVGGDNDLVIGKFLDSLNFKGRISGLSILRSIKSEKTIKVGYLSEIDNLFSVNSSVPEIDLELWDINQSTLIELNREFVWDRDTRDVEVDLFVNNKSGANQSDLTEFFDVPPKNIAVEYLDSSALFDNFDLSNIDIIKWTKNTIGSGITTIQDNGLVTSLISSAGDSLSELKSNFSLVDDFYLELTAELLNPGLDNYVSGVRLSGNKIFEINIASKASNQVYSILTPSGYSTNSLKAVSKPKIIFIRRGRLLEGFVRDATDIKLFSYLYDDQDNLSINIYTERKSATNALYKIRWTDFKLFSDSTSWIFSDPIKPSRMVLPSEIVKWDTEAKEGLIRFVIPKVYKDRRNVLRLWRSPQYTNNRANLIGEKRYPGWNSALDVNLSLDCALELNSGLPVVLDRVTKDDNLYGSGSLFLTNESSAKFSGISNESSALSLEFLLKPTAGATLLRSTNNPNFLLELGSDFTLTTSLPFDSKNIFSGRVITVGTGKNYTDLQPAINAAQAGDLIFIDEGTYYYPVVNKQVHFLGNISDSALGGVKFWTNVSTAGKEFALSLNTNGISWLNPDYPYICIERINLNTTLANTRGLMLSGPGTVKMNKCSLTGGASTKYQIYLSGFTGNLDISNSNLDKAGAHVAYHANGIVKFSKCFFTDSDYTTYECTATPDLLDYVKTTVQLGYGNLYGDIITEKYKELVNELSVALTPNVWNYVCICNSRTAPTPLAVTGFDVYVNGEKKATGDDITFKLLPGDWFLGCVGVLQYFKAEYLSRSDKYYKFRYACKTNTALIVNADEKSYEGVETVEYWNLKYDITNVPELDPLPVIISSYAGTNGMDLSFIFNHLKVPEPNSLPLDDDFSEIYSILWSGSRDVFLRKMMIEESVISNFFLIADFDVQVNCEGTSIGLSLVGSDQYFLGAIDGVFSHPISSGFQTHFSVRFRRIDEDLLFYIRTVEDWELVHQISEVSGSFKVRLDGPGEFDHFYCSGNNEWDDSVFKHKVALLAGEEVIPLTVHSWDWNDKIAYCSAPYNPNITALVADLQRDIPHVSTPEPVEWLDTITYAEFTDDISIIIPAPEETLVNFPLIIRISDSSGVTSEDLSFVFDILGSNYSGLKIYNEQGSQLYVEVEKWDHVNKKAIVHVKCPILYKDEISKLHIVLNNGGEVDSYIGTIGSAAGKQVWDSNYKSVYHLNTIAGQDSTTYQYNINSSSSLTATENEGLIFDGINSYGECSTIITEMSGDIAGTFTIHFTPDDTSAVRCPACIGTNGSATLFGLVTSGNRLHAGYGYVSYGSISEVLEPGKTYVATITKSPGPIDTQTTLILNGEVLSCFADSSVPLNVGASGITIGGWKPYSSYRYDGVLYEVQLSNIKRSNASVSFTHKALLDTLLTYEISNMSSNIGSVRTSALNSVDTVNLDVSGLVYGQIISDTILCSAPAKDTLINDLNCSLSNSLGDDEEFLTPDVLGVSLWLDFKDPNTLMLESSGITTITDLSPNNNGANQITADYRPVIVDDTLNGFQSAYFDGVNDTLALRNNLAFTTDMFVCAVIRRLASNHNTVTIGGADANNYGPAWLSNSNLYLAFDANGGTVFETSTETGNFILTGRRTFDSKQFNINGAIQGPSQITYGIGTYFNNIGYINGAFNQGYLGELIVGTWIDHQIVEGYLAHKWGFVTSLPADHPYRFKVPTYKSTDIIPTRFNLISNDITSSDGLTFKRINSNGYRSTCCGRSFSSGKWYWEIHFISGSMHNSMLGGIGDSLPNPSAHVGQGPLEFGYRALDGSLYESGVLLGSSGPSYTVGDVISFMFDADAGKVWIAKNNIPILNGNPLTGDNPVLQNITYALRPAATLYDLGAVIRVALQSSDLTYTPPTGFKAIGGGETMEYISCYPPESSSTYVKASSNITDQEPWRATSPDTGILGSPVLNSWLASSSSPARFNIDYGRAIVPRRIKLENYHGTGGSNTTYGVQKIQVYGSNNFISLNDLDPAHLSGLDLLGNFIAPQHTDSDVAQPQYFWLENENAYRYIIFIFNDPTAYYRGFRKIEIQEATPIFTLGSLESELWLDPSDPLTITLDTGVSSVLDKSGKGRDHVQTTAAYQPTLITDFDSQLKVLSFDGINQSLSCITDPNLTTVSIFYVMRNWSDLSHIAVSDGSGNYINCGDIAGDSSPHNQSGTPSILINGNPLIFNTRKDAYWSTLGEMRLVETIGADLTSWNSIGISNIGTYPLKGEVAEVFVIAGIPDEATRQKIEGYFAHKWKLKGFSNLHPYKYLLPEQVQVSEDQKWVMDDIIPYAWFDAQDDVSLTVSNNKVGKWWSKSKAGGYVEQIAITYQPQITLLNGKQVVQFTQSGYNFMTGNFPPLSKEVSIFAVVYFDNLNQPAEDTDYVLNLGNGIGTIGTNVGVARLADTDANKFFNFSGNSTLVTGPVIPGQELILINSQVTDYASPMRQKLWYNGVEQEVSLDYPAAIENISGLLALGMFTSTYPHYLNGKIGEIIILDYVPDEETRKKIEGYLAHKWDLTLENHIYSSRAPEKLDLWTPDLWKPLVWLDADDPSTIEIETGVSKWKDKSENLLEFTQAIGSNQPSHTFGWSDRSVIHFNGTQYLSGLLSPHVKNNPAFTILVVYRKDETNNGSVLGWGTSVAMQSAGIYDNGTNRAFAFYSGSYYLNPLAADQPVLATLVKSQGLISLTAQGYLNGVEDGLAPHDAGTPAITSETFCLGRWAAYQDNQLIGDIAEVIIYPWALTPHQRQIAEGYLAHKWNLTLSIDHPYYASPPSLKDDDWTLLNWSPEFIHTDLWIDTADSPWNLEVGATEIWDKNGRLVATQPTESSQPTIGTLNGYPGLTFDGSDDYLTLVNPIPVTSRFATYAAFSRESALHNFVVLSGASVTPHTQLWIDNAFYTSLQNGTYNLRGPSEHIGIITTSVEIETDGKITATINGSVVGNQLVYTERHPDLLVQVGKAGLYAAEGTLGELIVGPAHPWIEPYLQAKWNQTPFQKPGVKVYKSGRPWVSGPHIEDPLIPTYSTRLPFAPQNAAVWVLDEVTYIASQTSVYSSPIIDGEQGPWTLVSTLPFNIGAAQAVLRGNRVYLIGSTLLVANNDMSSWTVLSLPNASLTQATSWIDQDHLWIAGGLISGSGSSAVYKAPFLEDYTLGPWTVQAPLNYNVVSGSATKIGTRTYIFSSAGIQWTVDYLTYTSETWSSPVAFSSLYQTPSTLYVWGNHNLQVAPIVNSVVGSFTQQPLTGSLLSVRVWATSKYLYMISTGYFELYRGRLHGGNDTSLKGTLASPVVNHQVVYPPVISDLTVKGTSTYSSSDYAPRWAIDPASSLSGSFVQACWLFNPIYPQTLAVDYGSQYLFTQIQVNNLHHLGNAQGHTSSGVRTLEVYGSNLVDDFNGCSGGTWLGTFRLNEHSAEDRADYQRFDIQRGSYRFLLFKMRDPIQIGRGYGGIRRIEALIDLP